MLLYIQATTLYRVDVLIGKTIVKKGDYRMSRVVGVHQVSPETLTNP